MCVGEGRFSDQFRLPRRAQCGSVKITWLAIIAEVTKIVHTLVVYRPVSNGQLFWDQLLVFQRIPRWRSRTLLDPAWTPPIRVPKHLVAPQRIVPSKFWNDCWWVDPFSTNSNSKWRKSGKERTERWWCSITDITVNSICLINSNNNNDS